MVIKVKQLLKRKMTTLLGGRSIHENKEDEREMEVFMISLFHCLMWFEHSIQGKGGLYLTALLRGSTK
jgi:hypothetical protein